eukprot:Em0011g762a
MEVIDLAKAKKLIRALLISCPRGMPAKDFAADFRNTMGKPLPFQNFGYRTLDDFVKNIPDVVKVSPGPNGEKYYYGVATAETQHVARLVATQKKPPAHRSSKPSACVRPTGFTKKGLAGPRARPGGFSGSAFPKRGPPMPPRFNRPPGNSQFQPGPYRPLSGQPANSSGYWKMQDPPRAVLLPAGMERDTHPPPTAALMKPKQTGARPDAELTSSQGVKQLSPKGQQNLSGMVRQLLEEKPNGIWVKRLKKELEAMFKNTKIPDDVGTLAMDLPFVQTNYPIPSNPIIYMKSEKQSNSVGVENGIGNSSVPNAEKTEWPSFTSPSSTSSTPPRAKSPAPLPNTVQLDEEFFDVIVTCINSTIDFYVQKSGNEKLLQQWQDDLSAYFASNVPKVASNVAPNSLYAYLWVDQEARRNYWCRVLVVSSLDLKADVTFPDYGDTKTLPYKDLKELPPLFYTLPFQAVQCALHGVSDTSEAASQKFMELADQELCVAQVMNSSGHRYALELIPANAEPGAETINTTILKLSQPISSLKPLLPDPGQPMVPVKLTDVDEDGIISVQLLGPGLTYLDQLLTEMNNPNSRIRMEGKPMGFVTQKSVGTICCAPYLDGTWYRAQIKKLISLKKVLVEYVDFGNEEEVDLNTTMLLIPSPSELFSLPFQAIKCTMHGLPPAGCSWTEASVEVLCGFIDSGEILLQVMNKPEDGGLPSVKLFYLPGDEEESQEDIGEYLVSQGAFSLPHASSGPAVPSASDKTAPPPSNSMKIVISGQSGSEGTRQVTLVQDGSLAAGQPACQRQAQNASPPSCQTSTGHVESLTHSSAGSKPSQNIPHSPVDDLVLGMHSLQITSKKSSSPPPLVGPAPLLGATPTSPPPLYNITSSPIVTPPPQTGVSTPRRASPIAQATLIFKAPSSNAPVPPCVFSPQSTPPSTPLSSPPIQSPCRGSDLRGRVFGSDPVLVEVTAVKSPDLFTVQLLSEKPQLDVVQQMLEHMAEPQPLQGTATMETLYCAKFHDQMWYRCKVTELLPDQNARVKFVDYGDEMTLHISALRTLPLSISGLPVLGITCTLGGVSPLEDKWSKSAVAFFSERVLNKSFFALFKEYSSGVIYVALTDTTSLVAKDLVVNGFAKEAK